MQTDVNERIAGLYEKDTRIAYANLQQLEAISEQENVLYPYLGEFIAMLKIGHYVIRVRGFRLLCMQAKWDEAGLIDQAADDILAAVDDEKPTAVRQALQYLHHMVPYKKGLHGKIRNTALSIDLSRFKDTMAPLIMKDIDSLLQAIEACGGVTA